MKKSLMGTIGRVWKIRKETELMGGDDLILEDGTIIPFAQEQQQTLRHLDELLAMLVSMYERDTLGGLVHRETP